LLLVFVFVLSVFRLTTNGILQGTSRQTAPMGNPKEIVVRSEEVVVELANRLTLDGGVGVESQSDALSNVVFQVATGHLSLEVVEDDGNERTSEEVHEVVVSADVSASKETIGASELGSGSLLGVEHLAIVVGTELESGTSQLNISTSGGHEEILISADLSELQLEFLSAEVDASLYRTSRLNGEAISLLNGNLRASLVNEVDLEGPTFFSDLGLVTFDVQSHQFSLALIDTNALVLSNGLPQPASSSSLLRKSEAEVLIHDRLRGQEESIVHKGFHGLNVQYLVFGR